MATKTERPDLLQVLLASQDRVADAYFADGSAALGQRQSSKRNSRPAADARRMIMNSDNAPLIFMPATTPRGLAASMVLTDWPPITRVVEFGDRFAFCATTLLT